MRLASDWQDYSILDTSSGEKLELWGRYILVRPDPQIIWKTEKKNPGWKHYDGRYIRSSSGGGRWEAKNLPESWTISYKGLTFHLKPMSFKHTGLFPEQAVNWDWMRQKIGAAGRDIRVLNLFAYTGAATLACAAAGAQVVHCDASRGMVGWAKENAVSSGLGDAPIRYIVDDCIKFVQREIRRGNRYDAIVMDPPSYGRGPGGEIWELRGHIFDLLRLCCGALSENPLFFLLNSYTAGLSPAVMAYLLQTTVGEKFRGRVQADEIGLPIGNPNGKNQGKKPAEIPAPDARLILPCGASALFEFGQA